MTSQDNDSHTNSDDISSLRSRLRKIHDEQLELLNRMMDAGPLIVGSIYQTYRTCSYPNCRCHRDQKHGPFPAISFSINGKHHSRPIRRDDLADVQRKADAYKRFQKALTQWRSYNRESEAILEKIRELSVEHYR